ncbi:MAG: hypothetical protein WCH79_08160 [Planctomycetia bacterium]
MNANQHTRTMILSGFRSLLRLALAIVALLALSPVAPAAPVTESRQLLSDSDQKLTVEVKSWLGLGTVAAGCFEGLVPLEFTVVNGGTSEAVITVRCSAGYGTLVTAPRTQIVAPPGSTVRSTVYVGKGPFGQAPNADYFAAGMLMINASPGIGPRREIDCQLHQTWQSLGTVTSSAGITSTPTAASTHRRVLTPDAGNWLLEARNASSHGMTQSEVDPATTPEDWRGWSSLREFVLTDDDWTAMPAPARRAMLEWIALGGHAILLAADVDGERLDRLGLPARQADGHRRVGAGEIIPLASSAIPAPSADDPLADEFAGAIERPAGSFDTPWYGAGLGRSAGFAERDLPVAAILVFLALLATIAGPVNIMLFAGRGRPSRIFWTTPVISLVATALLLGLMFFRDGVGGAGVRRTLVLLDPDRNTMAVLQEQFSRTGILLGRSFPIREPSWMLPQPTDSFAMSTTGMSRSAGSFVEVNDERRTGDWFSSRSDQAFTLQAVRPGRGRIEWLGPPDAPEVLSSLDVPLARLFLLDDDGKWWKTGPLDAGERRRLEPAGEREFAVVQSEFASNASPPFTRAFARLANARGYAWAEAAVSRKVAIATLDAIRWSSDAAWFVGPVVRTEGR